MFPDRVTLFVFLGAFGLLVLVLELVRRRALAEKYSLLWLGMAGMVLLLAAIRPALGQIALMLGIYYAPSALFVAGFAGVLVILLHLSAVITQLTRENRTAAQHIGLLQARLEELERRQREAPNVKRPT